MIVRRLDGDVQLVRQVDHDDLSGAFAAAWGGGGTWEPAPREDVVLACAEHDGGWIDWELAPAIDPLSGRAWHFLDVDVLEHLELYRSGIARIGERSRYAELLVSMHGSGIYNGRYGIDPALTLKRITPERRPAVQAFIEEQEDHQAGLREQIGAREDLVWNAYRLLQVVDRLSLYFCMERGGDPVRFNAVPDTAGEDLTLTLRPRGEWRATLEPYPFSGPQTFTLARRVLPDHAWRSDEAFRAAFEGAEPEQVSIKLEPQR